MAEIFNDCLSYISSIRNTTKKLPGGRSGTGNDNTNGEQMRIDLQDFAGYGFVVLMGFP
jgi:hypothetical protein